MLTFESAVNHNFFFFFFTFIFLFYFIISGAYLELIFLFPPRGTIDVYVYVCVVSVSLLCSNNISKLCGISRPK